MENVEIIARENYLANEPPNESCPHYHPWDCKRHEFCPLYCRRYTFYENTQKEDEEEELHRKLNEL